MTDNGNTRENAATDNTTNPQTDDPVAQTLDQQVKLLEDDDRTRGNNGDDSVDSQHF